MAGTARFPTTRWTLVIDAALPGARRTALEELCAAYWPPVYAFIRAQVHDSEQAKDFTQAFFLRFLEKHDLHPARSGTVKFRTYLLACVKHFLSNEWDRERAQKRGGGAFFPMKLDEQRFRREPADELTPERVFERHWATTLLERALRSLRYEFEAAGKLANFEALKGCLPGGESSAKYAGIATALNMSEGAVKVAVCRMRKRFRDILRAEIAETVSTPAGVDDELRYLLTVMCDQ